MKTATLLLSCFLSGASSYTATLPTRRSTMTMRKGRKSLKKTIQGSSSAGVGSMAADSSAPSASKTNWVPVRGISSMNDLPEGENEVKLVETMASQLIDPRTNPNGAVSVVNYEGATYCFAASCSCCKIPMTKAVVLPPTEETGNAPRVSCDFCKTTYNLRTGDIVADAEKAGLMGGIVKGLFSASDKANLPVYALGDKGGQVVISL
mmetsp:Transcript_28850/g.44852  ORF Transcript_28850/g.44852 Transcript_28850/m.44852 type:complete len:207 (-) Transcript_28850:56-676(-)